MMEVEEESLIKIWEGYDDEIAMEVLKLFPKKVKRNLLRLQLLAKKIDFWSYMNDGYDISIHKELEAYCIRQEKEATYEVQKGLEENLRETEVNYYKDWDEELEGVSYKENLEWAIQDRLKEAKREVRLLKLMLKLTPLQLKVFVNVDWKAWEEHKK